MEKQMKKIIALLLVLALSFCMFACDFGKTPNPDQGNTGNDDNNTPAPEKVTYDVPAEGYDGSEVTITFSHTMGQALRDVLDKYIVEFNKIYPNITVEHNQVGSYDDVRDQTQGSNPSLLHWQVNSLPLSHLGSPKIFYSSPKTKFPATVRKAMHKCTFYLC